MPQSSPKTPEPPQEKHVCARVTGPDPEIRRFLSDFPMEPSQATREADAVVIEVVVPEALVATMRERGLKVQVLYDASARGRERQQEVGKGNRFEGKDRVPKGLGVKTKEGGRELP